jgi:hypothetical protein
MATADPSLPVAERVDRACDSFEREWRAGRNPRVEDYVVAALESDRDVLRPALEAVEAELKARAAPEATVARPPDQPVAAVRIGRFEVRAVLGSGAFGCVYRAFDPSLDREVALKVPLAESLQTPADRDRFLTEARAAAGISHPNVCQIHEVGEHDGQPYIVMALVPGRSLAEVLRGRTEPLPERQAAVIVRKLALALAAAHDKGVVHRDLKPANVMYDKERKVLVVMDFGMARRTTAVDERATQTGIIMGTPAYMSPEQASGGAKSVGPAGDVFSLGIMMYEMLTGTRPFTGSPHEVIGRIILMDPEPPSVRRPGLDPRLEATCLKALAKDPATRFASMKEFADALDGYLCQPDDASAETEVAWAIETTPDAGTGGAAGASTDNRKLAELFDVISQQRALAKAETAAAVEAAARHHRTPRWIFAALALLIVLIGAAVALVFIFQNREVKVVVELKGVDLNDTTLTFVLDDRSVTAEELRQPIPLKPGDHLLLINKSGAPFKKFKIVVKGGFSPGIEAAEEPPPTPVTPPASPSAPPSGASVDPEAGFESLFNGKDLTGWGAGTKAEAFRVDAAGNLIAKSNPTKNETFCLLTEKEYGDYVMRFEYQFDEPPPTASHSSVAIRSGPDHIDGRGCRLEVQLRDTGKDALGTGAFIFVQGTEKKTLAPVGELAPGVWHSVEIEFRDRRVKVTINGKLVNDVDLSKLTGLRGYFQREVERKQGRIGLQSYREETKFRNIRVKELRAPAPLPEPAPESGFVSIFNGKDLTGWKPRPGTAPNWVASDGVLTGSGKAKSYLVTEKGDYADFHLRVEVRIKDGGNSGIFVRTPFVEHWRFGYEVQINATTSDLKTGGIYYPGVNSLRGDRTVEPVGAPPPAGKWFTLEVVVRGDTITVIVDQKTTATLVDKDGARKGHIALQQYDANTVVEFRNIRVKELGGAPPK